MGKGVVATGALCVNHYPRHIGDILSATIGLSLMERGAYTALIDQYYAREAPLPIDKPEVYRLAAVTSAAERRAVDYVLGRYFIQEPDGWHQKRCDVELDAYRERSESARASAAASVAARKRVRETNAQRTLSESINERSTDVELASSQKPVAIDQKQGQEQSRAAAPPLPPKPAPRAKRLPQDWALPDAWGDWARQERPDWDEATIIRVGLKFRDYWLGKGTPRADWQATWRNWVREERGQVKGGAREPTLADRRAANMDAICGRGNGRTIDAGTMDGTPVRSVVVDLRKPDDDDVGGLPAGGHHGRMA